MENGKDLNYYLSWIPSGELDQPIDHQNRDARKQIINKDLGSIADNMPDWVGNIATNALGLPQTEIVGIQRGQYSSNFGMQK